ncbi:MAG: DUF177 domain-containing protein [Dehalococcoidia bacterium]
MDLQVNVAQLLKEQVGGTRIVDIDAQQLELEDAGPASVTGKVTLTRTDMGVWASGAVGIEVKAECSRCVTPFDLLLKVKVDEVYLPLIEVNTGAKLRYESLEDLDALKIDEHHVIDFTEAFRQYLLAAMPMAPVCKDDCKGICSQCGAHLNEYVCDCAPELDPRWEKLRQLLN